MYNMPMQLAQFIVMILMITQYNEYKVANTWYQCHCTATSMDDIEWNIDGTTHSIDTYDNSI